MDEQSIAQLIDQQAEIRGKARDAMAGAVVLTEDRTPVYIDGLSSWEDSLSGAEVRVTGVLRKRSLVPEPTVDDEGAISHGIAGKVFVLENASWTIEAA